MSTQFYNPTLVQRDWFESQSSSVRRAKGNTKNSKLVLPILLFVVLLAQVWVRITILNSSYELEQMRQTVLHNDERLRATRLSWSMKSSPSAVKQRAKKTLNMIPLTPQFIRSIPEAEYVHAE